VVSTPADWTTTRAADGAEQCVPTESDKGKIVISRDHKGRKGGANLNFRDRVASAFGIAFIQSDNRNGSRRHGSLSDLSQWGPQPPAR
jgi:hypothetical protein